MNNVVQFPTQPRVQQFLAEDYMKDAIRYELGVCAGLLHGTPTEDELFQFLRHLKSLTEKFNCFLGVRAACD